MSKMDVWSNLRWISASTMTLWHHFHSTKDSDFPYLGPTWPVSWYKGASICLWDSIPMAQTLVICLLWIYEVVWGGYQPQTWCYGIIVTQQVTLTYRIWWGHHGQCHGIRVHPLFRWDSISMAKLFCVCLIWMFEVIWGEYQPQTWRWSINFTPQVAFTSQICWGQLDRCHGIRVHPYVFETAYQWLKHIVYV
jgi:hypothetical protein